MQQVIFIIFFFLSSAISLGQTTYLRVKNSAENDTEIKKLGLALSKSLAEGNNQVFLKQINLTAFYPKVILSDSENKKLTRFNKKFKSQYDERIRSFPKELINKLRSGDFYNFVSYYFDPLDKTYHLIFRYYSESYGIDYHDYRILQADNGFIIDDIFVYTTNQTLSETLKLYYLSSVPKDLLSSLTSKPDYKYILMLKNFVDASNKEDYQKAYKHITLLNQSLDYNDRFVALLKLDQSLEIGEEAYFESMEDVLSSFALDPSINLIAIRYHYLNKDFEKVSQCINNIQNHTNDPFLDFEKGNLAYATKDFESAAVHYQSMIKNYPDFHLPKFSLLVVYNQLKAYDKATKLLDLILKTSSYEKGKLIHKVQEQLPGLNNSSAFKSWSKK